MLPNFENIFTDFSLTSKVWIYLSNRKFDETESDFIQHSLNQFTKNEWKTHGKSLHASGQLLFNQLIVMIVDEDVNSASGCSIDSSVHMIKKLGSELNVDFFNRLYVLVLRDDQIRYVHISDLKNYKGWKLVNPMISNLSELQNQFILDVEKSVLFENNVA
jgi:hypothetical protein